MAPPTLIYAIVIVLAIALLAWGLSVFHDSRMHEGFDQIRAEKKSVAFVQAVKQAESFSNGSGPLAPPASLQQQRKTAAYVTNGFATFFSDNTDADASDAVSQYLAFFQPTQSDLLCDFTNISTPTSCLAPLDTITSNDTALAIPYGVSSYPPYAGAPNASTDTRVYVLGSVYNFVRTTINVRCLARSTSTPYKNGAPSVDLILPAGDYATRVLHLLRPTYIRASVSGSPASLLYWVDYGRQSMYTSQQARVRGDNTFLFLVQVTGFDEGIIDPIGPTPLPSIDTVVNPSNVSFNPPIKVPKGSTSSLVLYYPKYMMPSPLGTPDQHTTQPQRVATLYTPLVTGTYVSMKDSDENEVLSMSCPATSASSLEVTVGFSQRYSISPLPTGSPAFAVACASYDILTIAVMTPVGTTMHTYQLMTPVSYFQGGANSITGTSGAPASVGLYTSTSIPNYADIALQVGCLALPPSSPSTGVETFTDYTAEYPKTIHSRLDQGNSLSPGETLINDPENPTYSATYRLDGQLVVNDVYRTGGVVWESGTPLPPGTIPGKCTLGKDGILRLTTGGAQTTSSAPYWVSGTTASPPDQAPFSLVVTPSGKLQIVGRFSASPIWSSS